MGGGGSRAAGVGREGGGERKGGGAPEAESPPGARGEVVGARAGDQGRSPPQRGRPAGPAGGKDRSAGGGITGLGARRGQEVGSREGMRGGRERSGCGSAPPGAGTADQRPADREPRDCCHLEAEAGDAGCGDRWAVRWLGRPLPSGPARCLSERPVERKQVHWGYRARKPGPRALVTGQQTCVQLFFL